MAEYIEREAAIEAAKKSHLYFDLKPIIKSIPAADVRPVVRGRWIPTNDADKMRCSRCDVIHLIAQYPHGEINFCPNCGARMEES